MKRLLLLIAVLAVGAGAARATPVVAIEDDLIWHDTRPEVISARVDQIASTGAQYARIGLDWIHVAPARPLNPEDPADPAYDWSRYDRILVGLRERGVGSMVTIHKTPTWASDSGKEFATPRTADAASFAAAVAKRYNGTFPNPAGGVLPAIRSLGVRNEPNISIFNAPQCRKVGRRWVPVAPKAYAQLLTASEPKIRAANPNLIIVAGEMGSNAADSKCGPANSSLGSIEFTRLMHKALGGTRNVPFDMWAQHIYPVGPPDKVAFFPSWRNLPQMMKVVNRMHPQGRMPLIISETGYTTSYTPFHRYFVSEAQQAQWLDLTYRVAARNAQVEAVVWFNIQDHRSWTAGLFRADGSKKPSFDVFHRIAMADPLPATWALP
jgi:hypothetical protein